MSIFKNFWQHPSTTIAGLVIAGLTLYVSQCPSSKYAAGATAVLGILSKSPWA
jgi:hypothetical protein